MTTAAARPAIRALVPPVSSPMLDRLDVYRLALEFQTLAAGLVPRRGHSTRAPR